MFPPCLRHVRVRIRDSKVNKLYWYFKPIVFFPVKFITGMFYIVLLECLKKQALRNEMENGGT